MTSAWRAAVLTAAPTALNFVYRRDDAALPTAQSISVFSTVTPTLFTVSAATTRGGNWLTASPTSGQSPSNIAVGQSFIDVPLGNLETFRKGSRFVFDTGPILVEQLPYQLAAIFVVLLNRNSFDLLVWRGLNAHSVLPG